LISLECGILLPQQIEFVSVIGYDGRAFSRINFILSKETNMRIATAVLLLLLLSIPVIAADIDGKWIATIDGMDGNKMELTYNFKAEGTKLTGSVTSPMGEMQITQGKIEGNAVEFTVGNEQFSVSSKGTLSGDEIKLTSDVMGQTSTSVLKRVK
jgi:hypothetical protein